MNYIDESNEGKQQKGRKKSSINYGQAWMEKR